MTLALVSIRHPVLAIAGGAGVVAALLASLDGLAARRNG